MILLLPSFRKIAGLVPAFSNLNSAFEDKRHTIKAFSSDYTRCKDHQTSSTHLWLAFYRGHDSARKSLSFLSSFRRFRSALFTNALSLWIIWELVRHIDSASFPLQTRKNDISIEGSDRHSPLAFAFLSLSDYYRFCSHWVLSLWA